MPLLQTKADASAWGYGFLGATATSNFFLISQQVLGSTATTVTFSSIPSTYKSLQLRVLARDTYASSSVTYNSSLTLNSNTNYTLHYLQGNNNSVTAVGQTGNTVAYSYGVPQDSTLANTYGASIIDIIDYSSTTKYKTIKSISGADVNNGTYNKIQINSALSLDTTAVTTITFNKATTAFAAGSVFSLYGVS